MVEQEDKDKDIIRKIIYDHLYDIRSKFYIKNGFYPDVLVLNQITFECLKFKFLEYQDIFIEYSENLMIEDMHVLIVSNKSGYFIDLCSTLENINKPKQNNV